MQYQQSENYGVKHGSFNIKSEAASAAVSQGDEASFHTTNDVHMSFAADSKPKQFYRPQKPDSSVRAQIAQTIVAVEHETKNGTLNLQQVNTIPEEAIYAISEPPTSILSKKEPIV